MIYSVGSGIRAKPHTLPDLHVRAVEKIWQIAGKTEAEEKRKGE
jgi:hypothetical protein